MQTGPVNINIDDSVLVKLCQKGDCDAMERLIIKYQNRIYNIILKICANTEDAAELTQDTFVKVIENIGKFEGKSSFYTWLFRVAVNLTLSWCKRNVKLGFRSIDSEYTEAEGAESQSLKDVLADSNVPPVSELAENRELCRIVMNLLMKLDDPQRTVLVLRDIEGMDYAQIAKVLDVELGTVKSRISRARANLRDIMEVFCNER